MAFWDSPLCTHWHMWHTYTQPLKNTHKCTQRHMLACRSAQIVFLLLLLLPRLFLCPLITIGFIVLFMSIAIYCCCCIYWFFCSNHVLHMLQTNKTKLQNMLNKCCKTFRPVLQSMFNKCCKTFRPVPQSMFNKCCKTFRPLRAMMQQWMLKGTSKEILSMHTANHPCSRHCKAFHTQPTLPWELCSSPGVLQHWLQVLCRTRTLQYLHRWSPCSPWNWFVPKTKLGDTWNMKLLHVIYFPPEVTSCLTSWSNQRCVEI